MSPSCVALQTSQPTFHILGGGRCFFLLESDFQLSPCQSRQEVLACLAVQMLCFHFGMHVDVYAFVVDASAGQSLHIAESPGCFQVFVCSPGSGCSLQGGCMEKRITLCLSRGCKSYSCTISSHCKDSIRSPYSSLCLCLNLLSWSDL